MLEQRQVQRRQQRVPQPVQVRNDSLDAEQRRGRRRARCGGSQPSCTANTMISISPTQKVGSEKPRIEPAMIVVPATARRASARHTARAECRARSTISTAVTASSSVAGMRSRISRSAGSLNTKRACRGRRAARRRGTAGTAPTAAGRGPAPRWRARAPPGRPRADQDVDRIADRVDADEDEHRHRRAARRALCISRRIDEDEHAPRLSYCGRKSMRAACTGRCAACRRGPRRIAQVLTW